MTNCDPNKTYDWLMGGADSTACDAFDAHVLASVIALAMDEANGRQATIIEAIGLEHAALIELVAQVFPHARMLMDVLIHSGSVVASPCALVRTDDERCLGELLLRYSTARNPMQYRLASIIARRALRPNHLWQDLGLRDRGELSHLMIRHFRPLAERNAVDMKWKKFLYRMICRDEGYRLCTAPSCAECDDFSGCFGDESGESLLAHNRRDMELRTPGIGLQNA